MTATKTGGERNETRFAEFFVQALDCEEADRDRNGRVSVLEAFDFAAAKVKAAYEKEGHILTEHAAHRRRQPGEAGGIAVSWRRERSRTAAGQSADPALRALLEQRDALERQVADLRLRKDSMDQTAVRPAAREAADRSRAEDRADQGDRRQEMRRGFAALALLAVAATAAAQGIAPWRDTRGADIRPNVGYDGQFTFVRLRYGPPVRVSVAADSVVARLSGRRAALHADHERGHVSCKPRHRRRAT